MPIREQDIHIVQSQVMADVPEGGGAPTAHVVADGASNAIFADVTDVDRVRGAVSLAKVFSVVQTADTDRLMGQFWAALQPADPQVSISLFADPGGFSRRAEAADRMAAYLHSGPAFNGYLLERHIRGMRQIQLFCHPSTEPPPVGRTLYLVQHEGEAREVSQYVRARRVDSAMRTYVDDSGNPYQALVITLELSGALERDFMGSPPSKYFRRAEGSTLVRDTVVADAARYYGSTRLADSAQRGDLRIHVQSVMTQLVPASQAEIPILNRRAAGTTAALIPAADADVTLTIATPMSAQQIVSTGVPIQPGSVRLTVGSSTITDSAGQLMRAGAVVGVVRYGAGELAYTDGTLDGTKTLRFRPAAAVQQLSDSAMQSVTAETRGYNWSHLCEMAPAAGSVSVSYRAQGRWYTLRDAGDGVLRGADESWGAGQVRDKTIHITTGSLPDAGSAVLFFWGYGSDYYRSPMPEGAAYLDITAPAEGMRPDASKVRMTWQGADGQTKTAQADAGGVLSGDATGEVRWQWAGDGTMRQGMQRQWRIRWQPKALPAPGTVVTVARIEGAHAITQTRTGWLVDGHGIVTHAGLGRIQPGTVYLHLPVQALNAYLNLTSHYADSPEVSHITLRDNGSGALVLDGTDTHVGTVDYTSGAVRIAGQGGDGQLPARFTYQHYSKGAGGPVHIGRHEAEGMGRCTPQLAGQVVAYHQSADAAPVAIEEHTVSVDALHIALLPHAAELVPDCASFVWAGVRYTDRGGRVRPDGVDTSAPDAGSINYAAATARMTVWQPGTANVVQPQSALARHSVHPVTSACVLIPSAPVRPQSLQIEAQLLDGTTVRATADQHGAITSEHVQGQIDYESGVVQLYFGRWVPDDDRARRQHWYRDGMAVRGRVLQPAPVRIESILYSAIAYTYVPIDDQLLGISATRLPADGRVPIFRAGGLLLVLSIHTTAPQTVRNGQTVSTGKTRLSRIRLVGSDDTTITSGYTADLDAGTVTVQDASTWQQPIRIEHMQMDLTQAVDVGLDGTIQIAAPISHDHGTDAWVCSVLEGGTRFARVHRLFSQEAWGGKSWQDTPEGNRASASYNDAVHPITVTNAGAVSERWALKFANSTEVDVIGEHIGHIGRYPIAAEIAPINPASGAAYFCVSPGGWGGGWVPGNTLFVHTTGAECGVWIARTVQPGASAVLDDHFRLLCFANVDRP